MHIKIINILLLIASVLGLIGLCAGRFYFPNKFWIALLICTILGPLGHFYIRGGFTYFLVILLFQLIIQSLGIDGNIRYLLIILVSVFLMILRFKIERIRKAEQES